MQQYNKTLINFDDVTKDNIKEHISNWPQIPDDPYRILIIRDSGPGKTTLLFNLLHHDMIEIHKKQNINC